MYWQMAKKTPEDKGWLIEIIRNHRSRIIGLMFVSFIVAYLGGRDAIKSTVLYNKLDLENELTFRINEKYNKNKSGEYFPDLNFKGELLSSGELVEINVSSGDFDSHEIGENILVFKTKSGDYMTEYEIGNQLIIQVNDFKFSFVFIPSAIFALIGIISLYAIIKIK